MSARRLMSLAAVGTVFAWVIGPVRSQADTVTLAPVIEASAEAATGTFHPYSSLVLPDVIFGQMGVSHAEVSGAPRAAGIAGPLYAPAAGLLGLIGLPKVPPQLLPYCESYFPGDPTSASCVGPRQDTGGLTMAFANGQTKSGGDFTDLSKLFSNASVLFAGAEGKEFSAGGGSTGAEVKPTEGRWTASAALEVQNLAVGGALTIESIASSATAALNGTPGSGEASRRLAITGATVGGHPVDITPEGVVVAGGPSAGAEQAKMLQATVDNVLKQANLTVKLVPGSDVQVAPDGSSVVADSGGVVVGFDTPKPGPQGSGFSVVFGRSLVRMSAYNSNSDAASRSYEGRSSSGVSMTTSEKVVTSGVSAGAESSPGSTAISPTALQRGARGDVSGASGDSGAGTVQSPEQNGTNRMVGATPSTQALPGAESAAVRDNTGLGVRHIFLILGVLAVVGPLLVIARRIPLVFGG